MNRRNPLKDAANHLASKGRYGDTMMVHMNPIEVDMLASLSPTGQLTTNPDTGQKEAFLPLLFSMAAPAIAGASMPALAASALGTGIGTIAEGGSLKEGITAGLMGGITGGLMDKFIGGSEMFKDIGKTAGEALPETVVSGNMGLLTAPTSVAQGLPPQLPPSQVGGTPGMSFISPSSAQGLKPTITPSVADPSFLQKMGGMATDAFSPENIGQTAGSVGSGLVGEMYVPFDDIKQEEESEFQYEGPYMPTEQRRMIPMGDPLASAFEGEQMMLEGDVLPQGYNMRPTNMAEGGIIGGDMSGIGLMKNMIEGGMPMGLIQMFSDKEEEEKEMNDQAFNIGGLIQRFEEGGMPDDPQKQIEAMANEQIKRFRDFQPEGMLKGTFFDYVPDKTQTMLFMMDRMGMPVPGQGIPADDPERVMNPLDPRRTMSPEGIIDDRGPDFRFTEEELFRIGDRPVPPRRKLMEPVR